MIGAPVVLTPPDVLFDSRRWDHQKWYTYILQHPLIMVGLFGMVLILLSVAGGEETEFWVFKHFHLSKWSRIVSFATGILFVLMMLKDIL